MGKDYQQEAPFRGIRIIFRLHLFDAPWFLDLAYRPLSTLRSPKVAVLVRFENSAMLPLGASFGLISQR